MSGWSREFRFTPVQRREIFAGIDIGTEEQRELFLQTAESEIRRLTNTAVEDRSVTKLRADKLEGAASALLAELRKDRSDELAGLLPEELEQARQLVTKIQAGSAALKSELSKSGRRMSLGTPALWILADRYRSVFDAEPGHSVNSHFARLIANISNASGVHLPEVKKRNMRVPQFTQES